MISLKLQGIPLYENQTFLYALEKKFSSQSFIPFWAVYCLDSGTMWDVQEYIPTAWYNTDGTEIHNKRWVSFQDPQGQDILRHSLAHTLAQVVKQRYKISCGIGPVTEEGFFYEFSAPPFIKGEDLTLIQQDMQDLIGQNIPVQRFIWSKEQAQAFWANDPLKSEILEHLPAQVSVYQQGQYVDLCTGPHVPHLGYLSQASFELTKIAGSAPKGETACQRVYGIAFAQKKEFSAYKVKMKEAAERDHRKIGRDLQLFHMQEEAKGSVFWHPNGWTLYRLLQNFVRTFLAQQDYQEIATPQLLDQKLWEQSGHWNKFDEHMMVCNTPDRTYALKPMNCPGHIQVFKQGNRSYKDLPLRLSEFGSCMRYEPSGSLMGLMRVRSFCQDDAHIFCTTHHIAQETEKFCHLLLKMYKVLGFTDVSLRFSDRPEKRLGDDALWDKAENALKQGVTQAQLTYTLNKGEGAFYGPKLEFVLKDALGRQWQCGTLQVDFILPQRLDATYMDEKGERQTPVMLHRAVLGSFERFIGIVLEHYKGRLPLFLAPIQGVIITVGGQDNERLKQYQRHIHQKLAAYRIKSDTLTESFSYRLRHYMQQKIPYIIILGDKECDTQSLTLRAVGRPEDRKTVSLSEFISLLSQGEFFETS